MIVCRQMSGGDASLPVARRGIRHEASGIRLCTHRLLHDRTEAKARCSLSVRDNKMPKASRVSPDQPGRSNLPLATATPTKPR